SLCVRHRFWDIPIFVAGHGVIELSAIFIAGGAGLLLARAMVLPGDLKRRDALVTNGLLGIKLIMGCVPMLLIAGIIEGFISPSHTPPVFKLAAPGVTPTAFIVSFLKPDLRRTPGSAG